MTKIPTGPTIAHAYRFAFGHGFAVLRAIALPLLAQLAVVFLLTRRSALFLAATAAHDPSAATLVGPELLLIVLAVIFFFAQFTAVTEIALGHPPHAWISFPFGKPMWRLLGGFATAIAVIAAIAVTASLILMVLSVLFNLATKNPGAVTPAAMAAAGATAVIFFCVMIFFFIRFLFLLAPVNVAERQLGVRRAWTLSAGNFWRAFLVSLAIMGPIIVINYAFSYAMAGPLHIPAGASPEALQAAETVWRINQLNAMADRWYLSLPLMGVLIWFQLGAGCAAQVFAWRALTEGERSQPVAAH